MKSQAYVGCEIVTLATRGRGSVSGVLNFAPENRELG